MTVAQLEERQISIQRELSEHKRLCEEHKAEHKKEVEDLKGQVEDLKKQVAVLKATTSPWIKRLEVVAMWIGFLLLAYIAAKLGLMDK